MSIKDIEERESQLSAMYDGELPQAECELVARRLSRDENLRRSWENYALIGAAMRSEQMAGHRLAPKVAAAISRRETAESGTSGRSARSSSTWSRWAVPLGSAGLAASIAVIGVLGMFWLGGGASNPVANKTETATASTVKEIVIPAVPQDRTIVVASASPASRARVADVTRAKPAASSNAEPESYVTPPARPMPKGMGWKHRTGGTSGLHRTAQEVTPLHREVRIRATETSRSGQPLRVKRAISARSNTK